MMGSDVKGDENSRDYMSIVLDVQLVHEGGGLSARNVVTRLAAALRNVLRSLGTDDSGEDWTRQGDGLDGA